MKNQVTPEEILFELFKQAVKNKDKKQFSYFCLYSAILHSCEFADKMQSEEEEQLVP